MGRVTVSDWSLAQACGGDIHVGKAFAFIGRSAFAHPGLSWIARTFGDGRAMRPRVVSLIGVDRIDLPGASLQPVALPPLRLSSVTCDKAIYREGQDEARLLVLDPLSPGAEIWLELVANGQPYASQPVQLDERGAAAVALRDLPVGEYEARTRGALASEPPCSFTVAAYRLAPLVASLVERTLDGPSGLRVKLRLEAFGVPVDGRVALELTDRGRRLSRTQVEATGGLCEARLGLEGEGPHALNIQLVADPSRTATVPIVGSRAAERAPTLFSTLGTEVSGALLPTPGSRPVRGIFLDEGAERTSPLRLERVDARRARLRAAAALDSVRFVAVDPTFPRARPDAISVATARHPGLDDPAYQKGEQLFHQGRFADARALFERGLSGKPVAHPNYAYYVACCWARLGEPARAMAALRVCIEHGWRDFAHLAADDDLAALRGLPAFDALGSAGAREQSFDDVKAGQTLEIDVPGPLSLLVVGAYVGGAPWEGWAALLAPDAEPPTISVAGHPVPDTELSIDIDAGTGRDGAVYVIVKDARLLSPDTPQNRLGGQLKRCVEASSKVLAVGKPTDTLASIATPPAPAPPMMVHAGSPYPQGATRSMPMGRPMTGSAPYRGPSPSPAAPAQQKMRRRDELEAERSTTHDDAPLAAPRAGGAPPPHAAPRAGGAPPPHAAPRAGGAPAPPNASSGEDDAPRPSSAIDEPEVLFAGLCDAPAGKARVTVRLAHAAADYVVEAFVLSGLDWQATEARFRAEKIPSIALELPAFVHPDDAAVGRAIARVASDRMRVRVLRDGHEVPLLRDGSAVDNGEILQCSQVELSFLAAPGEWSAVVEDVTTGAADWTAKQIDSPGKLRRVARGLRLLSPGDRLSRAEDPSIVGLRILPGLERPFEVLVDATADYGHACCEQTAAKMLAACGMYASAAGDAGRRARAEAIVIAGVRRERLMFLPGLGFKMYPESSREPDRYWGPLAARYLWSLSLLRDLGASHALLAAVDEAVAMAADACAAYRIAWPPSVYVTCEEAYRVVRFSSDAEARRRAVAWVASRAAGAPGVADLASGQGAVVRRAEAAYAAAALLRGGGREVVPLAIALANGVTRELGQGGRLYSTVDSVAAIAMMAELQAAGVVGGSGRVEVDGQRLSSAEAASAQGELREIAALEGLVTVEVSRVVEEDWEAFSAALSLRVSLERGGRAMRRFSPGDAIDLRVTLEDGYKAGDLLWVCLPDGLSRVVGGGQIKRFSVDFEGKREVVVPLAATGLTVDRQGQPGPQRFAVCVRNMFEEERAGNPGLLDVTVEPPPGTTSSLARMVNGLRSLFG
jgi:hypothetical protein